MSEDSIIRNRLLVDLRPLKKVIRRFQSLKQQLLNTAPDIGAIQSAYSLFIADLDSFELGLHKHQLIHDMNQREQLNYTKELEQTEGDINIAQKDIEALKIELEHQQRIRKNKIEYDTYAKRCLEYPTRETTLNNIARLEKDILELEREGKVLKKRHEMRRKWVYTVINSVYGLQDAIKDDAAEDEQAGENEETADAISSMLEEDQNGEGDGGDREGRDDDDEDEDRRGRGHGRARGRGDVPEEDGAEVQEQGDGGGDADGDIAMADADEKEEGERATPIIPARRLAAEPDEEGAMPVAASHEEEEEGAF